MKKLMKKRKLILSVGAILLLFAAGAILYGLKGMRRVEASEPESVYRVLPGDPEWEQLGSVEEKIRACSVDEEVLRNLTDEELVQAVLDYPFLIDLFLADDPEVAVQSLRRNSDALKELLSRENAKDILMSWVNAQKAKGTDAISAKEAIRQDEVTLLLLHTEELRQALTQADLETLSEFSAGDSAVEN